MTIHLRVEGERFGNGTENFLCPGCNVLSLHRRIDPEKPIEYDAPSLPVKGSGIPAFVKRRHLLYQCIGCPTQTYFLLEYIHLPQTPWMSHVIHQFPIADLSIHASVPIEVQKAMREAELSLAVGAANASGTMSRRAMHALCQNKGAKGKDLHAQLLNLRDTHAITPDLWEWAEELRIVGRSGAHPEWEEVSLGDAEYAVKFLREIVRYVYINPAERAEKKLKETKKKKI